jgi:hypothetical protein
MALPAARAQAESTLYWGSGPRQFKRRLIGVIKNFGPGLLDPFRQSKNQTHRLFG